MKKDRIPLVTEKLKYLLVMSFQENDFDILRIEVEVDEYDEDNNGDITIISYSVYPKLSYNLSIDGYGMYNFIDDLGKVFEKAKLCVSSFTIEKDGKIVRGNKNVSVTDTQIFEMNYKVEETHEFLLSFIIYPK